MEQKHHGARDEETSKKKRRNKNKGRNKGRAPQGHGQGLDDEAQQARHRKQRQSRRKGGAGAGRRRNQAAPGASDEYSTATFRLRSEEKRELVGRRTLQVLSPTEARGPSPPSPTLVGILDIPAATPPSHSPSPRPATAVAIASPKAGTRTGAPVPRSDWRRNGVPPGSPGRPDGDVTKPLDADWLQRLLAAAATAALASAKAAAAAAASVPGSPGRDEAALASPCDRWISCSAKLKSAILAQLAALPACPCSFPANVFYYNKIWDSKHARYFRWRDASGRGEKLDVYHPGASYCIRSASTGMLAAQHCCYDRNRLLLTRGSGAGTPALVSPDVSASLHDTLDVRPWRICKGDFTRYNELRPPNNDNNCAANPDDAEFQRQKEFSQFY